MLDYAASRQAPDSRITWRQANALSLPFDDAAFDLVCCQFGAMFFPDRIPAYREARRVLKPGGRFLFNVWDRIEENVFADDVTNALARCFRTIRPAFSHARRMATMIRRLSDGNWGTQVFPGSRSRREPNKAMRLTAPSCRRLLSGNPPSK